MIVSGGENVYPIEVEEALSQHPAVLEVAVIGVPDERWGETVKALVIARPGAAAEASELVAFARERLAGYKLPRVGRVRRRAAADPDRARCSSASCARRYAALETVDYCGYASLQYAVSLEAASLLR